MPDTPTRILIADDEPPLLRMMSMYLERKGFSVTLAGRASEVRSRLASPAGPFAVVVMDATLPGSTLDELAAEILRGYPSVRVLVASGYPVDMSQLDAAAPGRAAFLHKPFAPDMLLAAVRRLLGTQEKKV